MLTTNYANDVLAVSGTITGAFSGANKSCGTGCSLFTEIPPHSPFFDFYADGLVNALGTYQGTASTSGGNWVMQMIALRVAGQTTIANPAPTAASVLPTSSPEAGGVPIAITGTGFLPGANVTVTDGTHTASAVNCAVASATTINCVTPVFPINTTATLIVTNPDSQATAPLAFAYTASTPFSTAGGGRVSPDGGATNGGQAVTITGSDFASGATVTVGGIRADEINVINNTTITAVVPAGSVGNQTVEVKNPSRATGSPGTFAYSSGAGINFVQANSAQPTGTTNVSAAFNIAQTAGDLNVVVIGWADTSSTIQSVTDSAGNTYVLAVPSTQGTGLTQAMYYAKNINASGANTVTVKFSSAPATPDLRILEYSGLDTANPLDGGVGGTGTGAFLDSGSITPSSVGDMILGASTVGGAITPALGKACADNSCKFSTAIYTPYEDNVTHAFPSVAGPFDATANQTPSSAAWVTQVAAFRQPAGALPNFSMAATALSPASVTAGSSATSTVTVTPSGGFTSAVALTCTGLPSGGQCNFVPPSVTPGAGAVTSALTITTTSATPAGSSTVTVTGTSGSLVNPTTVTLVVTAAVSSSFTLAAANPASATVSAGTSATSTITVNGSGGFAGTVNLACSITTSSTPAPVCSLPASVSLSAANTSATAMLTVSTTAATAAVRHSSSIFYAMFLPIGGITLLGVSFGSRRKKLLGMTLVFLMASGLLFVVSCGGGSSSSGGGGGGNPGTPAGTYTVTITATSGSAAAQTTPFTLTVQ